MGDEQIIAQLLGWADDLALDESERLKLGLILTGLLEESWREGYCDAVAVYNYDQRLLDRGWPTNH
jgi:hypothetical protein